MPTIEIDGIKVDAAPGKTIIEVADSIDVAIPRFCYHRKLSVAANCRMCLVQVGNAPKALPACATPVAEGMQVWTKSKETIAAQRAVMEFLLINHPLDCPICDQGGECELQDVSMQYGAGESRYTETKRAVLDHNIGPLIATEMTRCIQCTRCVRFGTEISGERELGATGRGEHMEIGTFINKHMHSEVSGNIIDLCPVGALTSKPYRFKARAWELQQAPAIGAHDCIGANLYVHSRNQIVLRVVPKDTPDLNEIWLADRDRFSYEALYHADRIQKPLLRKQERWVSTSWNEALQYACAALQQIVSQSGADAVGFLVSPSQTCEDYYLLQKFARGIGCNNIDHRLRQLDFSMQDAAPLYPNLGIEFAELASQNTVLIIGSNIAKEQPLASIRLREMVNRGGNILAINSVDYQFNFDIAAKSIVPAGMLLNSLAAVAKELLAISKYTVTTALAEQLEHVTVDNAAKNIAAALLHGNNKLIILGQQILMHPQAAQFISLSNLIAKLTGSKFGYFSEGANAAGAWLAGCVPHRTVGGASVPNIGKNAAQMLSQPLKCYVLFGIEPEYDSVFGAQALEALKQADYVIAFSAYQSEQLLDIADIVLPISLFAEVSGHRVNINGDWQNSTAAVQPVGDSRDAWKILRVLATLYGLEGFAFNTLDEVTQELRSSCNLPHSLPVWQWHDDNPLHVTMQQHLTRLAPVSLYAIDSMVRRATALQQTRDARLQPAVEIHSATAAHYNVIADELVQVTSESGSNQCVVKINDAVAPYTAIIYQANRATLDVGLPFAKLRLIKMEQITC